MVDFLPFRQAKVARIGFSINIFIIFFSEPHGFY